MLAALIVSSERALVASQKPAGLAEREDAVRVEGAQATKAGELQTGPSTHLRLPLAWVHTPKTGTSFVNALTSLACDPGWNYTITDGKDHMRMWIRSKRGLRGCRGGFTASPDVERKTLEFRRSFGLNATLPKRWYPNPPLHLNFGPYADTQAGLGVIMLRQPEQRVLSGYYAGQHGWSNSKKVGGVFQAKRSGLRAASALDYTMLLRGCQVRMLVRASKQCSTEQSPPTDEETDRAIDVLRRFQFVGITEEWALSICLWHRMFAGRRAGPDGMPQAWWRSCHPSHFINVRPTDQKAAQPQAQARSSCSEAKRRAWKQTTAVRHARPG